MTLKRVFLFAPLLLIATCGDSRTMQQNLCISHGDCMLADKPFCDGMQCRACMADNDCMLANPMQPYCETATGMCHACITSVHCTNAANPVCDSSTYTCKPANMARCSTDAQCGSNTPFCINNTCVACNSNQHCETLDPAKPTCDTTSSDPKVMGSCRACTADSECASGVCIQDGDCPQVAPVSALAVGQCVPTSMVTAVTPANITAALAGNVPYLKLDSGNYPAMTITRSVALVGAGRDGATTTTLDAIKATVSSGQVSLRDLKITTTAVSSVTCRSQTNLCLMRTRIDNSNSTTGVSVDAAVDCNQLTLERSWVRALAGNAVLVGNALSGTSVDYRILNNVIVQSGSATNPYAIIFGSIANPAGLFSYNSLVDNRQTILCLRLQTLSESVLAGPSGTTAPSGCTAGADVVQSLSKPGDFTVDTNGNPTFNAAGTNMVKDVIDQATTQLTPALDYNSKPRVAPFDRGAIELK